MKKKKATIKGPWSCFQCGFEGTKKQVEDHFCEAAVPETKRIKVDWDFTDEDHPNRSRVTGVPTVVDIPIDIPEDEVADWLSDKYGWCVNSWDYKEAT